MSGIVHEFDIGCSVVITDRSYGERRIYIRLDDVPKWLAGLLHDAGPYTAESRGGTSGSKVEHLTFRSSLVLMVVPEPPKDAKEPCTIEVAPETAP